jgi:hypothetical protein
MDVCYNSTEKAGVGGSIPSLATMFFKDLRERFPPHLSRFGVQMESKLDKKGMPHHLFLAGVPATGKSWLGRWLAEQHG